MRKGDTTEKTASGSLNKVFTDIKLATKMKNSEEMAYSLHEAIADIALQVGSAKFTSIDSRLVVNMIIKWAQEFEKDNENSEWGINTELDYLEAIEQFTDIKIRDAVDNGLGYIDNE